MPSTTETLWFTDSLVRVLVDERKTSGAYAVMEFLVPAGGSPPPHVHAHDDESFVVLEGEITLFTEAGETVVRPGQAVHSPAGEVHTFAVTGTGPARIIIVTAPAAFLAYVRACGRPAEREALPPAQELDVDLLVRMGAEHGITFVGPPGSRPADLVAQA